MTATDPPPPRLALRLLIPLVVGCVVAIVAVLAAWVEHGGRWILAPRQSMTAGILERTGEAISAFRKKHGRLPAALEELGGLPDAQAGEYMETIDGWDRPLVYGVEGDGYTLVSLGRDGRPGGIGLDYDLGGAGRPLPPASFPTLAQFLFEMDTGRMIQACLACGIMAALAALVTVRGPDLGRGGLLILVVKLALVTGVSLGLAIVLSALEMPSGH